jgi:hypothetical protein
MPNDQPLGPGPLITLLVSDVMPSGDILAVSPGGLDFHPEERDGEPFMRVVMDPKKMVLVKK